MSNFPCSAFGQADTGFDKCGQCRRRGRHRKLDGPSRRGDCRYMQGIWDFLVEHLGPTEVLSPIYLACFCLIAFWIYLVRKEEGGFIAFLLPRDIWRHQSIRIDFAM